MTRKWILERREVKSQARPGETFPMFNILEANDHPDEFYSGKHFTIAAELDSEEDARLIAAAPELLAALKQLVRRCSEPPITLALESQGNGGMIIPLTAEGVAAIAAPEKGD